MSVETSRRLASLDILRGLTLFMLVFFQPVLYSLGCLTDCGWILYNFDHEEWVGFRLWDLVMPLFMFLSGVSIPFSLEKYGNRKKEAFRKVLKRFLLLFLLGMVVQGNMLSLDPSKLRIYVNTLQAIGAGYLIASSVYLFDRRLTVRCSSIAILLIIYWVPMSFFGDYSPTGNFAYKVDELLLGRFRGDLSYTWIWSSLNFGATVLMGSVAGSLMKSSKDGNRISLLMAGVALICICLGLLASLEMPIIKRIWTSSMTLYSGGLCLLLMAVFYWWIDVKGHSGPFNWLKIYGMNSIAAYLMGECINFRSVAHSLLYGCEQYLGDYYGLLLTTANSGIIFLILFLMYRNKVFLRI